MNCQVEYRNKGHGEIHPEIIAKYSCILIWSATEQIDGDYTAKSISIIAQFARE